VNLKDKKQFCFEVAQAIGWHAYNEVGFERAVYVTNGTATFSMVVDEYLLPPHQVKIFGLWPRSETYTMWRPFAPNETFSIKCSAKKKIPIAVKDIEKRFLNWFTATHAKMAEQCKAAELKEIKKEREIGETAEAINADNISRISHRQLCPHRFNVIFEKGNIRLGKDYMGRWHLAYTDLSREKAIDIINNLG